MTTGTLAIVSLILLTLVAGAAYSAGAMRREGNRHKWSVGSFCLAFIVLLSLSTAAVWSIVESWVEERSVSPDGRYEAYIGVEMTIDGPNQTISVRHIENRHFAIIENLSADVDAVLETRWSPESDLVLFRTRQWLIVTRPEDFKTVKVPLSYGVLRSNGGIGSDRWGMELAELEFAGPGVLRYRFDGSDQALELRVNEYFGIVPMEEE